MAETLNRDDLKNLTKEYERLKKLQAELNAEKSKGVFADKEAIKETAKLLNLTNGRIDRMGQLRGKTKETNNKAVLLKEANTLAKFQSKGTKVEADIAKQMVGVRKQLLDTSTAEKIQAMDMQDID